MGQLVQTKMLSTLRWSEYTIEGLNGRKRKEREESNRESERENERRKREVEVMRESER